LIRLSLPRTGVEVNQTLPEKTNIKFKQVTGESMSLYTYEAEDTTTFLKPNKEIKVKYLTESGLYHPFPVA